jgi:hypothetical protein
MLLSRRGGRSIVTTASAHHDAGAAILRMEYVGREAILTRPDVVDRGVRRFAGHMPVFPTREELYERADTAFYSVHPDAPRPLNDDPTNVVWAVKWNAIVERLLYEESDRIYWDAYPSAPTRIDPENPEHQRWVAAWNEIRDAIWKDAPIMRMEDDVADVDTSYLRADMTGNLEYYRSKLYEDLWPWLDGYIEARLTSAVELVKTGRLWEGMPDNPSVTTEVWPERESVSRPEQKISALSNVWILNGVLRGNFEVEITKPRD